MHASRVALVTGASRGIGRGIALEVARVGYDLAVNYVANEAAARAVQAEIQRMGRRADLVRGDVGDREDRRGIVEAVRGAYGRIDLLVNNAGIAAAVRRDILEAREEEYDHVMAVNLKGPYFLTQQVAGWMVEQKRQHPQRDFAIVNIGSISGYAPGANRGEYCISKAGVRMATSLWAARLAEFGIRVHEIRPGIIETDLIGPAKAKYDKLIAEGITPIRRWGTPADVGKAVAAIASGAFPFSTGDAFEVDGGFHLRIL
jgi:NAD(P)-dependent dehydrogenase (short-subunit alcohol dehydrogenase family)